MSDKSPAQLIKALVETADQLSQCIANNHLDQLCKTSKVAVDQWLELRRHIFQEMKPQSQVLH